MLQLHEDPNFHYEAIRALACTRYFGADVTEILSILPKIPPGDFDAWSKEWSGLAKRVLEAVHSNKLSSYSPITIRDVYLRASHYYFVSDFFLHGNRADPRLGQNYELWRTTFDRANAQLPIPGVHVTIPAPASSSGPGFGIPAIFYRAPTASAAHPRPTLIAGSGFDGNAEEMLHCFGFAALERGYNFVVYEGPGQLGLLHREQRGWIPNWEAVVTPLVDHIFAHKTADLAYVDTDRLALLGMSMGGYLAARAAAFEPRLCALVCIDGVYSMADAILAILPHLRPLFESGDRAKFNAAFDALGARDLPTGVRWAHDQTLFTWASDDGFACMQGFAEMTLAGGVAERIKMPAFIGEAAEDMFFAGQPARVVAAIGANAELVPFTAEQAAQLHCAMGALCYQNQRVFEWLKRVWGDE